MFCLIKIHCIISHQVLSQRLLHSIQPASPFRKLQIINSTFTMESFWLIRSWNMVFMLLFWTYAFIVDYWWGHTKTVLQHYLLCTLRIFVHVMSITLKSTFHTKGMLRNCLRIIIINTLLWLPHLLQRIQV